MDRLIQHCDSLGIKKLNLGFTGSSDEYKGLRKYKLHAGAKEYKRFVLTTKSFSYLDFDKINKVNEKIAKIINTNPSLEEIDKFSSKYYKYFI